MTMVKIELPPDLKAFVEEQSSQGGYGSSSEYVRELIRKDRDRHHLRALMLSGASSGPGTVVNAAYFEGLRRRARQGLPKQMGK